MNPQCRQFRQRLVEALAGSAVRDPAAWTELSWHEHLLGCQDCRDLLEAEQALDELLSTLPDPHLPRELAQRVLRRLLREREVAGDNLDALLDLASAGDEAPAGLADSVLAGLKATRAEEDLDRLLEAVPEPEVPAGLARDVLAGLAAERRPTLRLVRGGGRARLVRIAAATLLVLGAGWLAIELTDEDTPEPAPVVADGTPGAPATADEPSEELLANLDVLESWDLVTHDDLDVLLASLETYERDPAGARGRGRGRGGGLRCRRAPGCPSV